MTYEELLSILEKNGFYCEELTKSNRMLYVYSNSALVNNTNSRNVLAVLEFDYKESKLKEIQFYTQFYITKNGIATSDKGTVYWEDNKITPEKIDKKLQKMLLRIKTLAERAKLSRIKDDF